MRRSRAVLLGVVVNLLVLAGASFLWLREPWNPINPWNARRIVAGMTLQEVEGILGKARLHVGGLEGGVVRFWGEPTEKAHIIVMFSRSGGVIEAKYSPSNPPTLRQRIRMWLGWEDTPLEGEAEA